MAVCKFFLQGNCRFGESCRFEHTYASKYTYVANQNSSQAEPDDQIYTQVYNDVNSALKSGQWLLSSYVPIKDKAEFPGLVNYSPEEIRLLVYEAKTNNNLDQVIAQINRLSEDAKQKYQQIANPNQTVLKTIRSISKGENVTNPFESTHQENIFATAVAQNSAPFGQSQQSVFVEKSTVFGGQNDPKSIFSQANQQATPSVFGSPSQQNSNSNSIFASASQKYFGSSSPTQQSSNAFQKSPFEQSPNIFGQSQPTNQASLFGQSNQSQDNFGQSSQNLFAQANSALGPSTFTSSTQQNVFGQNPNDVFGQSAQNVFAQSPQTNVFAQSSQGSNVFGQSATGQGNVFGTSSSTENLETNGIYSKLEELSKEDIEAFSNESFELGFIPEVPPPYSLCF